MTQPGAFWHRLCILQVYRHFAQFHVSVHDTRSARRDTPQPGVLHGVVNVMKTEAAKYFYTTANGRGGPVGFDDLRALAMSGAITRRDKVWCEVMREWQAAGAIPRQGLT